MIGLLENAASYPQAGREVQGGGRWHGNCLLLNPGACGARRFHLPLTLAILTVADNRIVPEILSVE